MNDKRPTLPKALEDQLDSLFAAGPPPASTARAVSRIKAALDEVMPPIAFYGLLPVTPIGPIAVAATETGLIAIDYDMNEAQFVAHLAKKHDVRPIKDDEFIKPYLDAIMEYVQGKRITLSELSVDLDILTPFQRKVLQAALAIPRGQVATYAEIAERIGKPKAFRAVGQALRNNPIPIVLPCHRVIASDGTLGGYAGEMGSKRKVELLKIEGVMLA